MSDAVCLFLSRRHEWCEWSCGEPHSACFVEQEFEARMHNALFGDNSLVDPYTGAAEGARNCCRGQEGQDCCAITEVCVRSY